MNNQQMNQKPADVNLFVDDSAFTLTDEELLTIHGGGCNVGGGGSASGGGDGGSSYGPTEFRQDLATVGSATSLGNTIVPGGLGAAAGAGFGLGVVAEHRLQVVENVGNAVGYLVNNIAANEETHRSNII